jgi:hypothetical protein
VSDGTIVYPEIEQDITEFEVLLDTAERLQIESILEIGVYRGGTLARWGVRFPYCRIIGIDPAPQIERWDPVFGEMILIYGKSQDQETRARAIHANDNRPFDVIWIDGDHEYEAVKSDWEWAKQHAKKLVAFHDINSRNNTMIEVNQLWNEIGASKEYRLQDVSHCLDAWGIGMVFL